MKIQIETSHALLSGKKYPSKIDKLARDFASRAVARMVGKTTVSNSECHCDLWHTCYYLAAEGLLGLAWHPPVKGRQK